MRRLLGNKKHALADRGHDLYQTPWQAVEAIVRVERLPPFLWEPACGPGAIVRELRERGYHVTATDLIDYGCPNSRGGVDFLKTKKTPGRIEAILTNPPFKNANEFVAHALDLCPRVIMLLRLAFLESEGRRKLIDGGYLRRVHVFRNRLPMMHRDGWKGPKVTNPTAFAWFVWNTNRKTTTTLSRISWNG